MLKFCKIFTCVSLLVAVLYAGYAALVTNQMRHEIEHLGTRNEIIKVQIEMMKKNRMLREEIVKLKKQCTRNSSYSLGDYVYAFLVYVDHMRVGAEAFFAWVEGRM